jgi:CRP-like cAMP-binding protein
MSIETDIAFFQRVPVLRDLDRDALRILVIGAESLYLHSGGVLFHAGEAADAAFVLQEGNLRLTLPGKAGVSEVVGPGTLITEIALFTETKRAATATAIEPSSVARIPRTLFLKILQGSPGAAQRIRDHIANRADAITKEISPIADALRGGDKRP